MRFFEKYEQYSSKFFLAKLNLKKKKAKNEKFFFCIIYLNDKKRELPRLFFHHYFSLLFFFNLNGCINSIHKNSNKHYAQAQIYFILFFINKFFLKRLFWQY